MLIDIMNDHGLEQLVHFPTWEKNTLDLLLSSLPGQFQDIHSPDKLSDHDIVAGTLKVVIPPIKKPRRKVFLYQKSDYESMRKDAFEFAKEKYFNGYPDTGSVQENFNLITSFIQDLADKYIPSKTSRTRATENRFFASSDRFLVCKTDSVCIKHIFFSVQKNTLCGSYTGPVTWISQVLNR